MWVWEKDVLSSGGRVIAFWWIGTGRCLFHVPDAISISFSISPEMVSKEEIPQYDKEQVKHVKGVLRDSIEMLEQVSLPVFPGDTFVFQQLKFSPLCQDNLCLMFSGAN